MFGTFQQLQCAFTHDINPGAERRARTHRGSSVLETVCCCSKMLVLVTGLVFILWGEPCWGGTFEYAGDIRHYAVALKNVYIATEDRLYQLSHDLRPIQNVTQRGFLEKADRLENDRFHRVPVPGGVDATFTVNILLPYVENNTLVTCGVTDNECGYCEVLDLMNISKIQYSETYQVGPPWRKSASLAFLVNVQKLRNETYILSAVEQRGKTSTKSCTSGSEAVNLHSTNNDQPGFIFSANDDLSSVAVKTSNSSVEFVDGFQIGWIIYLFSNLPSGDKSNSVRLIWLEGKEGKTYTLRSLRGAILRVSETDEGSKLLASSVVPGGARVLWSGVFSLGRGKTNTHLALFDISPNSNIKSDADPVFCVTCTNNGKSEVSIRGRWKIIILQHQERQFQTAVCCRSKKIYTQRDVFRKCRSLRKLQIAQLR